MISYVLLLRGINVGGHRKLLMTDLKSLLNELDFSNVKTYIQSGNVTFSSADTLSISKTEHLIAEIIQKKYGFEVPIILLTEKKIKKIVSENPYSDSANIEQLYCTFIKNEPSQEAINSLSKVSFDPDVFKVTKEVIYFKLIGKASDSKITNGFFEKKLGESCTTRNWKTTLKLVMMANSNPNQ